MAKMITEVDFEQKLSNLTGCCNRKGVPVAIQNEMSDFFHKKNSNYEKSRKINAVYNSFMERGLFLPFRMQNVSKRCYL